MNIFAERLNNLLKERGISKYRFAKDIGVSRQTVVRWCNGLTKPNLPRFIKLMNYFDVKASFLLGFKKDIH